jgi:hypothetical protein
MKCRRTDTQGVILVLVLWVLAVLSLMLLALVTSLRAGVRTSHWNDLEMRGRQILAALANVCLINVKADTDAEADSHTEAWGKLYAWDSTSLLAEFGEPPSPSMSFQMTITAVDECGKVNVNMASPSLLKEALRESGAAPDPTALANAMLDWRDPDDSGVFEHDHYSRLTPAYQPANADFTRAEELLFVAGITPQIFFGEDANHNSRLDPEEDDGDLYWPRDNADGTLQLGLADIFTPYGDGSINVNGAPESVLRAALRTVLPEGQADDFAAKLVANRQGRDAIDGTQDDKPYTKEDELIAVMGKDPYESLKSSEVKIGFTSTSFRFFLSVTFPEVNRVMDAEMVLMREDDEIKVIEWHDGLS